MPMLLCQSGAAEEAAKVAIYYHADGGKGFLGRIFTAYLMLKEKGVEFEQKGFKPEDTAKAGCFAVPMLEVQKGGQTMSVSQTVAIAESLGDLLDMAGKEVKDTWMVGTVSKLRQLNCDAADFVAEAFSKAGKDPKWPERCAKWMGMLNFNISQSATPYFCSQETPTYADFHVLHPIEMMDIGTKGECFKDCDDLKKWFENMKETKGYKAYLEAKIKIAGTADRFAAA